MRHLSLLLSLLLPSLALAQASSGCGSNCKASTFTASRLTGSSVRLAGDAGIQFGDGTIQNSASAFNGSATSFTSTAAANAPAYTSNQGAEWCFEPTCVDRFQADGGYVSQAFNAGMYGNAVVADSSSNYGWELNSYSPIGTALLNARLFTVRNAGQEAFYVSASGDTSFSGAVHAGFVQSNDYYTNGAKFVAIHGNDPDNASSSIALKIGNASQFTTAGAHVVNVYNDGFSTLVASIDKDGNYKNSAHINCAMSAATTCTATVPTGDVCMCQARSGSNSAVSCAVSSTTATCTASGSNSDTWNIWVW